MIPPMIPSPARPKAPTPKSRAASAPAADPSPRRKGGRPPKGDDGALVSEFKPVTIRPPPELLARIDAEVERRNDASRAQGYATSRGAVLVIAVREFLDRAEGAAREKGGAS